MDESQTRLYTSYKLIHIKQCSTYSWSILSKETGQLETAALSSKGSVKYDMKKSPPFPLD